MATQDGRQKAGWQQTLDKLVGNEGFKTEVTVNLTNSTIIRTCALFATTYLAVKIIGRAISKK